VDIDGVEARAIAGDEEKVRCPPQQIVVDMEMRREFVACGTDLIDVCSRKDRRESVLRAFILQSIEPHVGTRFEDVGVDRVGEILDVENAFGVDGHRATFTEIRRLCGASPRAEADRVTESTSFAMLTISPAPSSFRQQSTLAQEKEHGMAVAQEKTSQ